MYKKKFFFIVFEGIEGSGKSYQSKKLYRSIKKEKLPVLLTREPGGSSNAEKIRKVILDDYFQSNITKEFDKYTDTLLYLAARNEHIINTIKPAILKKKIIICDRFIDSTMAYQVYGKGVDKNLVDAVHKYILGDIKPDLTFILKANMPAVTRRLRKRKKKNRYDKFSKSFYVKAQKAFIKIAEEKRKRYFIIENSKDSVETEKIILTKFKKMFYK